MTAKREEIEKDDFEDDMRSPPFESLSNPDLQLIVKSNAITQQNGSNDNSKDSNDSDSSNSKYSDITEKKELNESSSSRATDTILPAAQLSISPSAPQGGHLTNKLV